MGYKLKSVKYLYLTLTFLLVIPCENVKQEKRCSELYLQFILCSCLSQQCSATAMGCHFLLS